MANPSTSEDPSTLQDLSGGLNTLIAPNRLGPTFSPSATNCWYDDGAVQKRPGQLITSTDGGTVLGRSWAGYSMHDSIFSGSEDLLTYVACGIARNLLLHTADGLTTSPLTIQPTGTASVTIGTTAVTGVGTNWLTTARVGALFTNGVSVQPIAAVNSDTSITLSANIQNTITSSACPIMPSWASTYRVSYADMNQKCWITGWGGAGAANSIPVSWNGSTIAWVDTMPQAAYSLAMSNYMFTANTVANPSRVQWSALTDPTTWPAANFVDVNPNDGFPIVGLFYDGQSLCILKSNSMWKLNGTTFDPANPTYTLTQVYTPSDFFVNSPKSVQLFDQAQGFIMLGKKGLYSYNGAGAVTKLLNYDNVRSEFSQVNSFAWGNVPTVTAEPSSLVIDGSYWLSVPLSTSSINSSEKELIYVIDKTGAFWQWQAKSKQGIVCDMAYFLGNVYGVNSDSGAVPGLKQLNYTTTISDANSDAINATFTTKVIEFENQHRFGFAYVYYKKQSAGNLTFSYSIDEGSYTSTTIDMTAGTGTRTKSAIVLIGQVGRSIQFQFTNNVAAQTFEVYGVEFDHQELRQ